MERMLLMEGRSVWCCPCCANLIKEHADATYEQLRELAVKGKLPQVSPSPAAEIAERGTALAKKEAEPGELPEAITAEPGIKLRDEVTKELARISAMSPDIVKAQKYLRRLEKAYAKRIEKYASTIEKEAAECRRQGDAIIKSMQAPAPE